MKIQKKIILIPFVLALLAASCTQQAQKDYGVPSSMAPQAEEAMQPMQRQQIQASQKVDGDFSDMLFNFYADENKTALDLLKSGHTVVIGSTAASSGTVESINGVKPDSKHFWQLLVNGKPLAADAGSYYPADGDKLAWQQAAVK